MNNKNIFEKKAKIPDIVQEKANAAFRTIYTSQDEPVEKPQKTYRSPRATIIKIASTLVVAAVTVAVLIVAIAYFGNKGPEIRDGVGGSNQFSIMVCAAELEPAAALPISLDVSNQAFGYGVDWTGWVDYQINFPISVEGENISTVTYKADNAVFEVVSIDCPSIVKSGSTKTLDDYQSTYANGYDMAGQPIGKTEVGYYDSFSADYSTLQNSKYLLNICNEMNGRMDLYYLLTYDGSDDDECAIYTYMIKEVKITIEVTFTDGTTSSRTLGLFSKQILTNDTTTDGIEYSYYATQIFCYDENDADDATKQLISSQITRAAEICKDREEEFDGGYVYDEAYDDSVNTDTSDGTDATDGTETSEDADGADKSTGNDTSANTDTSAGTGGTGNTNEVNSTENTDNAGSDNSARSSEGNESGQPGSDSKQTDESVG